MMSSSSQDSICASCGKEDNGSLRVCTACMMVKYCNRDCQIAHRSQHKKACKKRAAELYDEKLFKEPPPRDEDCPICFQPLPFDNGLSLFETCCGKNICLRCMSAMDETGGKNKDLCPFCRTPSANSAEEEVGRTKKLADADNARAVNMLAGYYAQGILDLPHDWTRANELYQKAGELGHAEAYFNLGNSYRVGRGVRIDMKKATEYFELAAINGCVSARHNLGYAELLAGNEHRAMKHYIIAASAGNKPSLNVVKKGFMNGVVTKEEYEQALRGYQKCHD